MVTRSRRANPVVLSEEVAAHLFEDFTGESGEVVGTYNMPKEEALVLIGECEAVAYKTTRDGVTESYQHEFRKSSRPMLAVSHDGLRLYLLGGNYKFTHRGIEDR